MNHRLTISLALAAALIGCDRGDQGATEDSATSGSIHFASLPKAEVSIDGSVVGETPLTHRIAAGSHDIVLRSDAFNDHKATVSVEAGDTTTVDPVLQASDPNDPVAIAKLAAAFEIGEWAEIEADVPHRGAKDAAFALPLYPRGNVRLEDLNEYRIDVGEEFETAGKLVFKRGSKMLFETAFDPEDLSTIGGIPEEVLKAVKPGTHVTWGFVPEKGKATTARFKVVRNDARLIKRMDRLEERMEGQPEVTLCQMRAQLYLNKKLYLAAYFEGRRALDLAEDDDIPPSQALAVMQSAARRMNLKKTPLWDEVQGDIERIPSRVKERRGKVKR
ncbi:MAG: PEGA domain-containing protein [Planctomycetota bacterium]|nr:PEGA domain-containing protein [Planctomycetota bacterium]